MRSLNQRKLAAELGVSTETISRLTKQGAITPIIKEGMLIRYDPEQVRQQLADRAKFNATQAN